MSTAAVHCRIETRALAILDRWSQNTENDLTSNEDAARIGDLHELSEHIADYTGEVQTVVTFDGDDRTALMHATFNDLVIAEERPPMKVCRHVAARNEPVDRLTLVVPAYAFRVVLCADCAVDVSEIEEALDEIPQACDICGLRLRAAHLVRTRVANRLFIVRFGNCCAGLLMPAEPKSVTNYGGRS